MKVRDVMTHPVVTIREDATFRHIVETLLDADVSGAPVVDAIGRVTGIVTESDLLAKEAYPPGGRRRRIAALLLGADEHARKAAALVARDLMTSPAVCVSPGDTVHTAARAMLDRGIKRLPVVEDGLLAGIVSRHDVLRVFARTDADLAQGLVAFLRRCLYTTPEHDVRVSVTEGMVTLEGRVLFASDVRIVADLVWSFDGVIGVNNRLSYAQEDPKPSSLRWNEPVG